MRCVIIVDDGRIAGSWATGVQPPLTTRSARGTQARLHSWPGPPTCQTGTRRKGGTPTSVARDGAPSRPAVAVKLDGAFGGLGERGDAVPGRFAAVTNDPAVVCRRPPGLGAVISGYAASSIEVCGGPESRPYAPSNSA